MHTHPFAKAMTTASTFTENGMPTHAGSDHPVLDFFFKMGGGRGQPAVVLNAFQKAYAFDKLLALKALFHLRDVREGMGERELFRVCFNWLAQYDPNVAAVNIKNVPVYGRYDDLMCTAKSPIAEQAATWWINAINRGDALAAKWAPREGKEHHDWARQMRKLLRLDWKGYRQLIVKASRTVEQFMCSGNWTGINYNHVPSQAAFRYRKAFGKHDRDRYMEYVNSLAAGTTKVNAGAIHPHQIAATIGQAGLSDVDVALLEAQWKALPDLVTTGERFLPVVDVSGSMLGIPLDVAVALGIYLSQRNKSVFQDMMITFSECPEFVQLRGSLRDRVLTARTAPWGYNTNLQAVFDLVLRQAQVHGLSPEDMPETIIILSDMQFDEAAPGYSQTAMQMIADKYASAGYRRPNIVFWNLRTSVGVPAKADESGTQLVSGFSPNALKAVLSKTEQPVITPLTSMLELLQSERYEPVTLP